MKVIDCTPLEVKEETSFSRILTQVQDTIQSRDEAFKAQEVVVARLGNWLDSRYSLLRNLHLPGAEAPIPMVLVGPAGMALLNANAAEGIYKARGDSWWEMGRRGSFQPARQNLIKQTLAQAETLKAFLAQGGQAYPEILPVLLFTRPGAHVESSRPAVRIVLMDGVDGFSRSLINKEDALNAVEILRIADFLARTREPAPVAEPAAKPKPLQIPTDTPVHKAAERLDRSVTGMRLPREFRFKQKQWLILAVLAVLTALALITAILVVVFNL